MAVNLEDSPDLAVPLCLAAHQRLLRSVSAVSDRQIRTASRLPGWSVGHVLTHLARNADGHARRLEGALLGQDRPTYAGGSAQRAREIDQGAAHTAAAILADLEASQARLEDLFGHSSAAGWPNPRTRAESSYGPRGCAAHRLRETEMHHVDLGLGYEPTHWPDAYVAWDLSVLAGTLDARVQSPEDRRGLMAWLAGRGPLPTRVSLAPWG